MSSLADFVNEHRNKSILSKNAFNIANIGSRVSNSFHGFFKLDESDNCETLSDKPTINGQLPSSRNRRRLNGWLNFSSTDTQVFGLTRMQRIFLFFIFLIASFICFATAIVILPVLITQTKKFAALNTLGSVLFILSFGFLWGPLPYIQFLFSAQRRFVTTIYFFSVAFTLYTSLWVGLNFYNNN